MVNAVQKDRYCPHFLSLPQNVNLFAFQNICQYLFFEIFNFPPCITPYSSSSQHVLKESKVDQNFL